MAALAEYKSQLYQPGGGDGPDEGRDEPPTKVASAVFYEAITGRARHFGMMIGVPFGEPFWSRLPPAVDDPLSLLPRGVR